MFKVIKVSLIGLGYRSTSAIVQYRDSIETGDMFPVLKGLPTIDAVDVVLSHVEDAHETTCLLTGETLTIGADKVTEYAKQSACSIALRKIVEVSRDY